MGIDCTNMIKRIPEMSTIQKHAYGPIRWNTNVIEHVSTKEKAGIITMSRGGKCDMTVVKANGLLN